MKETTIGEFIKNKTHAKEMFLYDSYIIQNWYDKIRNEYHLVLYNFPTIMIREQKWFSHRLMDKDRNIHIVVKEFTPISYE